MFPFRCSESRQARRPAKRVHTVHDKTSLCTSTGFGSFRTAQRGWAGVHLLLPKNIGIITQVPNKDQGTIPQRSIVGPQDLIFHQNESQQERVVLQKPHFHATVALAKKKKKRTGKENEYAIQLCQDQRRNLPCSLRLQRGRVEFRRTHQRKALTVKTAKQVEVYRANRAERLTSFPRRHNRSTQTRKLRQSSNSRSRSCA